MKWKERTRRSGRCALRGQSSFAHQARQGAQGIEHIGQEKHCFGACKPKDVHAFKVSVFKSCISAFDCIASAVIESLPSWAAHRNITGQAGGSIGKSLTDIDDATMLVLICLVGAFRRRIDNLRELDARILAMQAGFVAAPFMALAFTIKAIGIQSIAELTKRTAIIVIATRGPLFFRCRDRSDGSGGQRLARRVNERKLCVERHQNQTRHHQPQHLPVNPGIGF